MIEWLVAPEFMTDAELIAAWGKVSREPGDLRSDELCDEIERRNLDF